MPGLKLLDSVRPVFANVAKTLTFTLPASATPGRLMLLVFAYDAADSFAALADWTQVVAYDGTDKVRVLAKSVGDNEDDTVQLALTLAAKDWLGQLLVFENGQPVVVLEASAGTNYAADATPPTPLVACNQAIDLEVRVWSALGALNLTPPAGMEALDAYSSAIATARSFLIAVQVANASGNLAAKDAASSGAATGSGVSMVLRDRPPATPAVLYDPVPGNIGFVGRDTRPPREAGLP
jgi:hypothetical protein